MLYFENEDRPGIIAGLAGAIGDAGLNIATFALGRDRVGGNAVSLIEIDGDLPHPVQARIGRVPGVKTMKSLRF